MIPMHKGELRQRIDIRHKEIRIVYDLWYINYDLKKEICEELTKMYEHYIMKKPIHSLYSFGPTYIFFTVHAEDKHQWENHMLCIMRNKKNLNKI